MKSTAYTIHGRAGMLLRLFTMCCCCLFAVLGVRNSAVAQIAEISSPVSAAPTVGISIVGNRTVLAFEGIQNGTYMVQTSSNMVNWTDAGVATESSPGQYSFTGPVRRPHGFFRIEYVAFDPYALVNPWVEYQAALHNQTLIEIALGNCIESKRALEREIEKLNIEADKYWEASDQDYFQFQANGFIIVSWKHNHYYFQNPQEAQQFIQSIQDEKGNALDAYFKILERIAELDELIDGIVAAMDAAEAEKARLEAERIDAENRADPALLQADLGLEKAILEALIAELKAERLKKEKEKAALEALLQTATTCADEAHQKANTPVNIGGSGNKWMVFWNGRKWHFNNQQDAQNKKNELEAERERLQQIGDDYAAIAEDVSEEIQRICDEIEFINFQLSVLEADLQDVKNRIAAMNPPAPVDPWDEFWARYIDLIELEELRASVADCKKQLDEEIERLDDAADEFEDDATSHVNRISVPGTHLVIWGGVVEGFDNEAEADAFAAMCEMEREIARQNAEWFRQQADDLHELLVFYCDWLDMIDEAIEDALDALAQAKQALPVAPPVPVDPFEELHKLLMEEALTEALRDSVAEEKEDALLDAFLKQLEADELRRKAEAGVALVMPRDGLPLIRVAWGSRTKTFDPGQEAQAEALHQQYLDEREQAHIDAELCQLIADLLWERVHELCDDLDELNEDLDDLDNAIDQAMAAAIASIAVPGPDPCAELARVLRELALASTAAANAAADLANANAAAAAAQARADAANAKAKAGLSLVIGDSSSKGSIVAWGGMRQDFPVGQEGAARTLHDNWKKQREQAAKDAERHQNDAIAQNAIAAQAEIALNAALADVARLAAEAARLAILCATR